MENKTIAQMFQACSNRYATDELLFYKESGKWNGITGKEINCTVKDISFALKSLGLGAGDHIAIQSNNSPMWAMADYGIICTGAATVSIYPTLIPKQIQYIINNSHTKAVFVENTEQLDKINSIISNCPTIKAIVVLDKTYKHSDGIVYSINDFIDMGTDFQNKSEVSFESMIESIDEDSLLTLIYTSGTTGSPKGVMLTHKNIISNIKDVSNEIFFDNNDKFLSFLPLSHIFERTCGHFTPFSKGSSIYYAESIDKVPENLTEVGPTVVTSVPRLYEKMYSRIKDGLKSAPAIRRKLFAWALDVGNDSLSHRLANKNLPFLLKIKYSIASKLVYSKVKNRLGGNLRCFVSGGAPLSKVVAEFFGSLNVLILEGYGLTETSPILTANTEEHFKLGTVGRPLQNVSIKIAEDGEILAKGPNIMVGYYENKEATEEAIDSDGWFHTGDIGNLDKDGFLSITDRKKNIIVTSQGKNVAPAGLENAIANSIYVDQVLVLGDKRRFVSALVVPSFENVAKYLDSLDIKVDGNDALVEHEKVVQLFDKEIEKSMQEFSNYERVKKIRILPRSFTIENGELTPKLSIVKKVVFENFDKDIEQIYREE